MRTCSPDREWAKAHALRHTHKSEPCVHREATGRVIHCHRCGERRQERRRGERKRRRERERGRKTDREQERQRRRKTPPCVDSKTLPCVRSRRLRVYRENARMCWKETITEIGMSIENAEIDCPAKPITHALIYFRSDDERNRYIRSANMLRKDLRGRKLKINRSMDAEQRFHQKRMEYVKYHIHVKHHILLDLISMNWTLKHVSVKGQIGKNMPKRKISRHRNRGRRSDGKMAIKKVIATTVSSRETGQRRRDEGKTTSSRMHTATQENQGSDRGTSEGVAGKISKKLIVTFQQAWDVKKTTTMTTQKRKRGRLKHYNVDGDVPLCLRKIDEESKDGSRQQRKEWQRKLHIEQHEGWKQKQNDNRK